MKIKLIAVLTGLVLWLSSTASALDAKFISVNVKGMVCSFCAQGIMSRASKHDSIEDVDVNLSRHNIVFTEKPGKHLSDTEVNSIITESGFVVESISRSAAPPVLEEAAQEEDK